MPKRAKPSVKRRPKSQPIRFTDAALVRAALVPPFDHKEGHYADPDLVIAGGKVPAGVPKAIPCNSSLVIYSSWADFVPRCRGYGGAGDGNNAIVRIALANAEALARRIKCDGDCTRRVFEIWRGWSCGPEGKKSLAFGAVEVMILCRDEF